MLAHTRQTPLASQFPNPLLGTLQVPGEVSQGVTCLPCGAGGQERQGAPDEPVIMNPMRHNIPAHIRNAADLANLSLDS